MTRRWAGPAGAAALVAAVVLVRHAPFARPAPAARDRARPAADAPDGPRARLRRDLTVLDSALARVPRCASGPPTSLGASGCAARAFADARAAYKRQEALVELLAPAAAAALNGRRQEVDDDDLAPPGTAASTFAALEAALPGLAPPDHAARPDRRAAVDAVDAGRGARGAGRCTPCSPNSATSASRRRSCSRQRAWNSRGSRR